MKINLKALRALCDAATDGGWTTKGLHVHAGNVIVCMVMNTKFPVLKATSSAPTPEKSQINTRFIAATDPQTVRALIDEIEKYKGALEFYADYENYQGTGYRGTDFMAISEDGGYRAREALGEK